MKPIPMLALAACLLAGTARADSNVNLPGSNASAVAIDDGEAGTIDTAFPVADPNHVDENRRAGGSTAKLKYDTTVTSSSCAFVGTGSVASGAGSLSHAGVGVVGNIETATASTFSVEGFIESEAGGEVVVRVIGNGVPSAFDFSRFSQPGRTTIRTEGALPPGRYVLTFECFSRTYTLATPKPTSAFDVKVNIPANLSVPVPDGDTIRWRRPAGGTFSTPANWNTQTVPVRTTERADTAVFDLHNAYTVRVGTQRTERLIVTHGTPKFLETDYTVDAISPIERSVVVTDHGRLVLAGGTLRSRHAVLGQNAGTPGEVQVFNAGTRWEASGGLTIGEFGAGKLFVANGGYVSSLGSSLGAQTAAGSAVVGGDGSSWDSGDLIVGQRSAGDLTIESGGAVNSHDVDIGLGPLNAGTGAVVVDGVSPSGVASSWLTTGLFQIGTAAEGRLDIRDGGSVDAAGLFVGAEAGGTGRVNVSGLHSAAVRSTLDSGGTAVGIGGRGFLNISDGALVRIAGGPLQIGSGSRGDVTVSGVHHASGTPSELRFTDAAYFFNIGNGSATGVGRLEILDGARVTADCPEFRVGLFNGAVGGVLVSAPGTGPVSTLSVTGTLKVGGETGGGGTLVVNRGEVHVTGDILVGANGTIQGVGTLSATGQIIASGFISPGLSPGTLTLDGDVVQDATSVVLAEIAGPAAGTQHDQLVITGTATLDGKLVLQFMNGFAPHTGDTFGVVDVNGAASGGFVTVEIAGLAPGALLATSMTGGVLTATAMNDGVALPTVSLKTGKSKKASEKKPKGALVQFSRAGDTSAALTVSYSVGGSAENGADYTLLGGSVILPAGKKSVTLRVAPIDDASAEGPETIELKVVAGAGYTNSLKSKAALVLVDDERARR